MKMPKIKLKFQLVIERQLKFLKLMKYIIIKKAG